MTKELHSATVNTVEDLKQFIDAIEGTAPLYTIYFSNPQNLTLVAERLTDGSIVYNIHVSTAPSMFNLEEEDTLSSLDERLAKFP